MLETLRSLVRPFFGFVGLIFSKGFGIRPMISLSAQIALQIGVVLYFFDHLSRAGTITVVALAMLFHLFAAFRLPFVAYGMMDQAYKDAKKNGKSDDEAERQGWFAYGVAGYLWTVIPATVSVGITFWCASLTVPSFLMALFISVYCGGILDVMGVGLPLYRLLKSQKSSK